MSYSRERPRRWAAIGPAPLMEVLAPLRDEHLRHGEARLIVADAPRPQDVAGELHGEAMTLLVAEDPAERSVRWTCPTPLLKNQNGAAVTVGWLRFDAETLEAYANRAVALLRRPAQPRLPLALLGPREQRYLDLLEELAITAESTPALVPLRWNAERLARHRLEMALRQGAAAAIYTGHGNARGWFAYGGVSTNALSEGPTRTADESIGVLFSLSCRAAQPAVAGESETPAPGLAEDVLRCGLAGAVLAPLGDPLHEHNRVLAVALLRALVSGERACADVVRAAKADGACLDGYAIIGDPAVPVAAAPEALERCVTVFAPAPDAVLNDVVGPAKAGPYVLS
jgi:hypothetical protein